MTCFESKIFHSPDGCWLWVGATSDRGYGHLKVGDKYISAHRYSYMIHKGEIGNMNVCHACDVRLCVNPDHLFLGTQKNNIDDMIKKGRGRIGQQRANNKLSPDQVIAIRQEYEPRINSFAKLARRNKISIGTVQAIIENKTWKHLS